MGKALRLFQFHKGTIRTVASVLGRGSVGDFNSIKVRLERVYPCRDNLAIVHFNSIKVRLEPLLENVIKNPLIFQFHKGTIRTMMSLGYGDWSFISIP